jgi:hypothetical protein
MESRDSVITAKFPLLLSEVGHLITCDNRANRRGSLACLLQVDDGLGSGGFARGSWLDVLRMSGSCRCWGVCLFVYLPPWRGGMETEVMGKLERRKEIGKETGRVIPRSDFRGWY